MIVSPTAIFGELFELQKNLALISKHVVYVPKEDILELFQSVKTIFSEIQTLSNGNYDGGVVYDLPKTDDPYINVTNTVIPVESDGNPDIEMVHIYLCMFSPLS